jgi:hypothetical protein
MARHHETPKYRGVNLAQDDWEIVTSLKIEQQEKS